MSLLRIDSSQSCRSACSSLALAYCLIARAWRRSSARCSIFAPASRRPASMTPTTCSSWSSAASIPFTPRRASAWRSSAFDRQVPMIEQCSVSQAPRSCWVSPVAATRRRKARVPQQDVGASIEPDQRGQRGAGAKIGRNGRQQRQERARYICSNIASMDQEPPCWKGVNSRLAADRP